MKQIFNLVLAGTLAALVAAGCSSGGPDPKVESTRIDRARQMRTIFDKAKGNYESLTIDDKAAFVAMFEDEAKAQEAWQIMKFGPGARNSTPQ